MRIRVHSGISIWAGLAAFSLSFSILAAVPLPDRPVALAARIRASSDANTLVLNDAVENRLLGLSEWGNPHRPILPSEGIIQADVLEVDVALGQVRVQASGKYPHFWAEPAVREHWLKGPGAFAGFGLEDGKYKDFAGVPYTDRRAYPDDNGFRGRSAQLASGSPPTPRPRVDPPRLVRRILKLSWTAPVSGAFRVWRVDELGGRPVLQEQISGRAGQALEFDVEVDDRRAFYYLETLNR